MSLPTDPPDDQSGGGLDDQSGGGLDDQSHGRSPEAPPPDARVPSTSDALSATTRIFRDLPGAVIPAYLLALGAAGVARLPVLFGLGLAVAILAQQGLIEPVIRAAEPLAQQEEPLTETGVFPEELEQAIQNLVTPEAVALVLGGVVAGFVVFVLVHAVSTAVTQTTVWAALAAGAEEPGDTAGTEEPRSGETTTTAKRALVTGVRGAGHWKTFLGLFSLKLLLGTVLIGAPLLLTAFLAAVSSIAAFAGVLLTALGALVTVVVLVLLSFAGPAIVVDDAGAWDAVKRSTGFVRRNLGQTVAFVLIAGGLYVGAGVLSGLFSVAEAGRVGALLVPLVVAPMIDLLGTALYAGVRAGDSAPAAETADSVSPRRTASSTDTTGVAETTPAADESDGFQWVGSEASESDVAERSSEQASEETGSEESSPAAPASPQQTAERPENDTSPLTIPVRKRGRLRDTLSQLFADGTRDCLGFVVSNPLGVVLALAAFVFGTWGGWAVTAPAEVSIGAPDDVAGVFGPLPVNDFLNIAANNWLVAASGAYSGLGFALPALAGAMFNGALVGALAGVFDRVAFLALVAPHGVIEIPTLLIAWGMGVHLGVVGWRAVRGRADAETVAERLRFVARALAGIAVLLVVASFVEAFLTPQIAALILG
jgi:uncharacterized membrane protein SpoIIM required for sporulation